MTSSATLRSMTVIAAIAAAGCTIGSDTSAPGGFRDALGLNAGAPDEFLIIANAPLQLPPSFDLARPTPGVKSRVEPNPLGDAHSALFRTEEPVRLAAASPGETVLLSGAGVTGDNSAIRAQLDEESPDDGPRDFALTSLFGLPIPASLDEVESRLETRTEVENLRRQGYLTPALPPLPRPVNTDEE